MRLVVGAGAAGLAALLALLLLFTGGPEQQAAAAAPAVAPTFTLPPGQPGSGRVTFVGGAAANLPRLDPRLRAVLERTPWDLHVTVLISGHGLCVHGTRRPDGSCSVSNHILGRAMDIGRVGGERVTVNNLTARDFVLWLAQLPADLRPDEVGSPFAELGGLPGQYFTDRMHLTHLHVGYDR